MNRRGRIRVAAIAGLLAAAAVALGGGKLARTEEGAAGIAVATARVTASASATARMATGASAAATAIASEGAGTVPPGLLVQVERELVTVRHPGRLVALRAGDALATGRDWAAVRVTGEAAMRLVWESTEAATLSTTRGVVELGAGEARAEATAAPRPAGEHRGRAHLCRAHEDGDGGLAVVCRVDGPGQRVRAANLLSGEVLEHARVITARDGQRPVHLARLDLPRVDGARAFALTYLVGTRAVLVRAEASRLPGELAPTLFLGASERVQPLLW
jgi:hypothetical protein